MIEVRVRYPEDDYDVMRGEEVGPGLVELREHAIFIPLAPGDVVRVDGEHVVTGVETLTPIYTYEVAFHLPKDGPLYATPTEAHPAMQKVGRLIERWKRQGYVTRDTNFSCLVSSQTHQWLREEVLTHKYVEHAELIRTPELRLNFSLAVQNPDLSGTHEGPWG